MCRFWIYGIFRSLKNINRSYQSFKIQPFIPRFETLLTLFYSAWNFQFELQIPLHRVSFILLLYAQSHSSSPTKRRSQLLQKLPSLHFFFFLSSFVARGCQKFCFQYIALCCLFFRCVKFFLYFFCSKSPSLFLPSTYRLWINFRSQLIMFPRMRAY